MDTRAKMDFFRRVASENYNKSMGWSVFTECYDETNIAEFVSDLHTEEEIRDMMATIASIDDDRYADAENSIF